MSYRDIIIAVILTQIALKFAIAKILSRVPYNIILDSQLVSSVVILIIAAIMSTLSNSITTDAFDVIAGVSTSGISILAHCMFLSFFFPGDSTIYAMGGYTGDKKQQKAILDDFVRQIVLYDRDGKEMLPTVNHQ